MTLTLTGYMRTWTRCMRTIWKIGLGTPNHWALLIQRTGRLCNGSALRWIFHEHDAWKEERFSKNVYSLNRFLDQHNLKKCKNCDVVNGKRHFFELSAIQAPSNESNLLHININDASMNNIYRLNCNYKLFSHMYSIWMGRSF